MNILLIVLGLAVFVLAFWFGLDLFTAWQKRHNPTQPNKLPDTGRHYDYRQDQWGHAVMGVQFVEKNVYRGSIFSSITLYPGDRILRDGYDFILIETERLRDPWDMHFFTAVKVDPITVTA